MDKGSTLVWEGYDILGIRSFRDEGLDYFLRWNSWISRGVGWSWGKFSMDRRGGRRWIVVWV